MQMNDDDPRQLAALRDLYAGSAISCFRLSEQQVKDIILNYEFEHELVARFCFDLADAMIAERQKRMEKQ